MFDREQYALEIIDQEVSDVMTNESNPNHFSYEQDQICPSFSIKHPQVSHECEVISITSLSAETLQIDLQIPQGTQLQYHAGQYLQLELDLKGDGQPQTLSYTIANSIDPARPRCLQLIIHNCSAFADSIIKHFQQLQESKSTAKAILPMGKAYLQTNLNLPHILIAAGSGISKIKAITEEMLRRKPDAQIHIYWSNKKSEDFYLLDQFHKWSEQNKNLRFTPILETPTANWTGRTGFIYEVVEQDFTSFNKAQVYLCGSPRMVYGTIDQLKAKGLQEEQCYSDVFEYAPRG